MGAPQTFPLAEQLGMSLEAGERGVGRAQLTVTEALLNPHGALHGAVPFALIDTAMGIATLSVLPDEQLCATIEIQLRFVRPVFSGELRCEARVVHAGKRIVHLEADVREGDRVVVTATGTYARLGD